MEEMIIPHVLSLTYNSHDEESLLDSVMDNYKHIIQEKSSSEALQLMTSTHNYIERSQWVCHPDLFIQAGDLCFIDYGNAYRLEAGYQHLGFVFSVYKGKIFVIPMSSNQSAYLGAYDKLDNPTGKKHLLRFKKSCGLKKNSILFLNDSKYLSPTRVIEIIGHLSITDPLYKLIQLRLFETLFKGR